MDQPHPTGRLGLLRIPGPDVNQIALRFSPLSARDHFDPASWTPHPLNKSTTFTGWWEIDLDQMGLADGAYEYEFVVNTTPVNDPYAQELTRFGGYRGLFTIKGGKRVPRAFGWDDEFKP